MCSVKEAPCVLPIGNMTCGNLQVRNQWGCCQCKTRLCVVKEWMRWNSLAFILKYDKWSFKSILVLCIDLEGLIRNECKRVLYAIG